MRLIRPLIGHALPSATGSVGSALAVVCLAAAVGLAGCTGSAWIGGSGASAGPFGGGQSTPPAQASPSGSSATASPSSRADASPPPTSPAPSSAGSATLVARVDVEGGFVAPGAQLGRLPTVVIYSDGSVYTQGPQVMIYPGPLLPNIQVRSISPAALGRLMGLAREKGLLRDARYEQPMIADAPTTVLTLVVDGRTYVQQAYALVEGANLEAGVSAADRTGRANLLAFIDALQNVPGADVLQPDRSYQASAYRIFVTAEQPAADPNLVQRPIDWPLRADLASVGERIGDAGMFRCLVLAGADAAKVVPELEHANVLTPFVSRDRRYTLIVRPLLPDESGC